MYVRMFTYILVSLPSRQALSSNQGAYAKDIINLKLTKFVGFLFYYSA